MNEFFDNSNIKQLIITSNFTPNKLILSRYTCPDTFREFIQNISEWASTIVNQTITPENIRIVEQESELSINNLDDLLLAKKKFKNLSIIENCYMKIAIVPIIK